MGGQNSTRRTAPSKASNPQQNRLRSNAEALLSLDEDDEDLETEENEAVRDEDRMGRLGGGIRDEDEDQDSERNKPYVEYAEGDSDEEGLEHIVQLYESGILPDLQISKHSLNEVTLPLDKLGVGEREILERGPGREHDYTLLEPPIWREERRKKQIFRDNARDKFFEEEGSIACALGFAMCSYSLWTFPQLCIKYGSVTFCIMYFVVTCVLTAPAIYLEMLLGQFGQTGPFHVWKITPIFIGLGVAMFANTFMSIVINNTRMVWLAFYSFDLLLRLPWVNCEGDWTTTDCKMFGPFYDDEEGEEVEEVDVVSSARSPAVEYFRARVLRVWKSEYADEVLSWYPFNTPRKDKRHKTIPFPPESKIENGKEQYGIDDIGIPSLDLMLILAVIYLLAYCTLRYRIRFIGAMNFLILFLGYILITVPFINGWIIPKVGESAVAGFFNVEAGYRNLLSGEAWVAVIKHSLIATGLGSGMYILIGSHRRYNNRTIKNSVFAAAFGSYVTHCFIALSMAIYWEYAKVQAKEKRIPASYFGTDPVIEVFPFALVEEAQEARDIQFLRYYTFSFYCGLVCLSVVRTFCGIYLLKRTVMDSHKQFFDSFRLYFDANEHGDYRRWERLRLLLDDKMASTRLLLIILIATYVVTIVCFTRGGIFIQIFLENYCGGISFTYVFFIEIIAVSYVWGTKNVDTFVTSMTCYQSTLFYRLAWKYFLPAILFLYIIHRGIVPQEAEFDGIKVPPICHYIGVAFASIPLLIIGCLGAKEVADAPVVRWRDKFVLSLAPHYEWTIIASGKLTSNRTNWIHYVNFPGGFEEGPGYPKTQGETYYTCKGCGQIIRTCLRNSCSFGMFSRNLLCLRFTGPQHQAPTPGEPMRLAPDPPPRANEMVEHIPNLKLVEMLAEDREDRHGSEEHLTVKNMHHLPDGTQGEFHRIQQQLSGVNRFIPKPIPKKSVVPVPPSQSHTQIPNKKEEVNKPRAQLEFDYERNGEEIRHLLSQGKEEAAERLKEIRESIYRQLHPNQPYRYDL